MRDGDGRAAPPPEHRERARRGDERRGAVRADRHARRRGAARDPRAGARPGAAIGGGHDADPRAATSSSRSGFLFTEGLIAPGDVSRVAYCDTLPGEDQQYNIVSVTLDRPFDFDRLKRNFYATSSCGVCGKAALDDIEVRCAPVAHGDDGRCRDAARPPRRAPEGAEGLRSHGRAPRRRTVHLRGTRSSRSARTSAATTPWTRSWASRSWPGASRSPTTCSR